MTPAELTALMESPAPHAVLDIRERGAYERGHIFRATSLPRRLLELRVPALITAPTTPIVLYDDDGRLSALARPTLEAMGYRDVRVLAGGLAGLAGGGAADRRGRERPQQGIRRARAPRVQDAPHHGSRPRGADARGGRSPHRGFPHP